MEKIPGIKGSWSLQVHTWFHPCLSTPFGKSKLMGLCILPPTHLNHTQGITWTYILQSMLHGYEYAPWIQHMAYFVKCKI